MRYMGGWTVGDLMSCPKSYVLAIMNDMANPPEGSDGDRG